MPRRWRRWPDGEAKQGSGEGRQTGECLRVIASVVSRHGCADRLLLEADEALYVAKRVGRNHVICAERALAEFAFLGRVAVPGSFRQIGLARGGEKRLPTPRQSAK
ncbi:hypothetical protein ACRQ5Q_40625 [Bradyrhizobium sp. PMVTL-01]|uniref:hypothetical protein n=1 Tax=Bradyrhizobium sp. PMVTL-01 TaxID=3434999 RepID=UPI003F6FFFCF